MFSEQSRVIHQYNRRTASSRLSSRLTIGAMIFYVLWFAVYLTWYFHMYYSKRIKPHKYRTPHKMYSTERETRRKWRRYTLLTKNPWHTIESVTWHYTSSWLVLCVRTLHTTTNRINTLPLRSFVRRNIVEWIWNTHTKRGRQTRRWDML